jgi:hypothetical protein
MKDIDFDELDRAVNSLANPAVAEELVAVPIAPAVDTVDPVPTVASTPLAARRSSGRFMDVVHPSSDMRTTVSPRPAALTLPAPVVAPVAVSAPVSTDMPDPLDFTPGPQESTPVSMPSEPDANVSDTANDIAALLVDNEPLDSPFITDAKVEKRPLGAFSGAAATELASPTELLAPEAETSAFESSPARPLDTSDDHPIGNDTPLPAELQGDVLSIEAAEETAAVKLEDTEVTETVVPIVAAAATETETPIGPTSITQQYTEQASTGDQPVGSIFDTEAYKKPLAHPKKKKSGWLMVLWIFLLLIIGAGAGAAVYFYVLPLL